ncbi:MAG TPA: hydroxymethylbilane synthase [Candidatus Obscuribacterales bacterium]
MTDTLKRMSEIESTRETIRVGTRDSKLARLQTEVVVKRLQASFPQLSIDIVPLTTHGDKIVDRPIAALGGRGVFVKELEEALIDGEVDLVVHSLKDLPTDLPDGLVLAAVLDRADPRDVMLSREASSFTELKPKSKVATSSRRRAGQLLAVRPDVEFIDIRGNIPTRVRKFDEGYCDAIILAAAGLQRLGLEERISEYFPPHVLTPAAGQGALAVECRAGDAGIFSLLEKLDDAKTRKEVLCERAFLDRLGSGCSVPVGALAKAEDDTLSLTGCIASLDGKKILRREKRGNIEAASEFGVALAEELLALGGEAILAVLRGSAPNVISAP